jgi:lysozyme
MGLVRDKLRLQLQRDERLRLVVYDDATGKPLKKGDTIKGTPTIGWGRNLVNRGLSKDEALYLLDNDVDVAINDLHVGLPWAEQLDDARRGVLANMCFNMGLDGLLTFKHTLKAIKTGSYDDAANRMLASKWAGQVKDRALRLSRQMRTGYWA